MRKIENKAAVDAWCKAIDDKSISEMPESPYTYRSGYMKACISALADDVPGVREWLINNMPKVAA